MAYLGHIFPRLPTPFAHSNGVVIRTNSASTSLTIDAAADTVKHYGAVGSLNIIAVANSSYHENGKVAFAEIKTGRIVLEEKSEVEHIHLTATGTGSTAYFNDITVAKAENVEMPEFSRDPVEIPTEGKLVVALQEGTKQDDNKEYVWLTAVGIYEQVTVSTSASNAGTTYATSNSVNAEKKETAQQIANNISAIVGGNEYTLTATTTDGGQTWTYALESDIVDNITEDVTVAVTTEEQETVVTVSVANEEKDTAKENGMSEAAKEEKQKELVNEAKAPEVAKEYAENGDALIYNLTTGVYYNELYTALDEVPASTKTTLILLKDVTGVSNKNYVIKANQIIIFDLNGCKFNTVAPDGNTAYAIENKGTLTIKDNTDKNKDGTGTGKLELDALDPDLQSIPGYASNVITNMGNLTVESGWIHNASSDGYAAFAIDLNANNGYNVSMVINGGKITSNMSQSIRQMVFTNTTNNVVINGGIIGSYWIQNYGTENATANGRLVINNVEALKNFNFDLGYSIDRGYGLIGSNVIVKINGGNFKGLSVRANSTSATNFLYGGTFNTKVKLNGDGVAYTINGGTFNDEIICEGTITRNGGTYNALVRENYATLKVWFGSSYITDAIVGEDYTIDTGYDLSGKVVSAQYYGDTSPELIDSAKITIDGSKITIDKTALHKFTGKQFCIWVSVSDAE